MAIEHDRYQIGFVVPTKRMWASAAAFLLLAPLSCQFASDPASALSETCLAMRDVDNAFDEATALGDPFHPEVQEAISALTFTANRSGDDQIRQSASDLRRTYAEVLTVAEGYRAAQYSWQRENREKDLDRAYSSMLTHYGQVVQSCEDAGLQVTP